MKVRLSTACVAVLALGVLLAASASAMGMGNGHAIEIGWNVSSGSQDWAG